MPPKCQGPKQGPASGSLCPCHAYALMRCRLAPSMVTQTAKFGSVTSYYGLEKRASRRDGARDTTKAQQAASASRRISLQRGPRSDTRGPRRSRSHVPIPEALYQRHWCEDELVITQQVIMDWGHAKVSTHPLRISPRVWYPHAPLSATSRMRPARQHDSNRRGRAEVTACKAQCRPAALIDSLPRRA